MTYLFKLVRRLAISRHSAMLSVLLILAACGSDSMAPEGEPLGGSLDSMSVQVSPKTVTLEISQRAQFRGHTRTLTGDVIATSLAWRTTGGSIQADGTFSSATAGTFKVIGRGRTFAQTDSAVVQVVAPQPDLASIELTPASVSLDAGTQHSFSATGRLKDGSTVPLGVTWSATGGTVDPSGVFTAGSATGEFRVITANTAGTVADTANVIVNEEGSTANPDPSTPPARRLARVVLQPARVTVASGSAKQFRAYGHTRSGDSVAVSVTFSVSGGSITRGGLYTAGSKAGTFKVIANSAGIADTAVVTLTSSPSPTPSPGPVQPPIHTGKVGIPFGASGLLSGGVSTGSYTMSQDGYSAGSIINRLNEARAKNMRVLLNMTGGPHRDYMTGGVFDMGKWRARMDSYNSPAIKAAVAAAVADGTILGNSVMDEPHNTAADNSWGPKGTMNKARVDQMCAYVKGMFPTLPVGVVHDHGVLEPEKSYKACEFLVDQYAWRKGDVRQYRDEALAMGRRDGIAIMFALNILDGGIQSPRNGSWSCPTSTTGGRGTYDPNCRMTAQQVRDWGITLGSAGCGLTMWRYDSVFMSKQENQRAFDDVAAALAKVPAKSCTRS